jgi:hypothetical protein
MAKKQILEEQELTSTTPQAHYYRNVNRPRVDKLFKLKEKSSGKKKKHFDFLARQLWRKIILHSNTL